MTEVSGPDPTAVQLAEAWARHGDEETTVVPAGNGLVSIRRREPDHGDYARLLGPLATLSVLRAAEQDLESVRAARDAARRAYLPEDHEAETDEQLRRLQGALVDVLDLLERRRSDAEAALASLGLEWDAERGVAKTKTGGAPRLVLTDLVGRLFEWEREQAREAGSRLPDYYSEERLERYGRLLRLCGFEASELTANRLKARLESYLRSRR